MCVLGKEFGQVACFYCVRNRMEMLLHLYGATEREQLRCFSLLSDTYAATLNELAPPLLMREVIHLLKEHMGARRDLWDIKRQMNERALEVFSLLKVRLQAASDRFAFAARLALAALQVDFYQVHCEQVIDQFEELMAAPLAYDCLKQLEKACKEGKKVLYFGAQAGSVLFDRLFIQQMGSKQVTYVVNSAPYAGLNVNGQDADYVDMRRVATVLDNGCQAPTTILSCASDNFKKIYDEADTILVMGQSNVEGLTLTGRDPRLYALLQCQCDCAAKGLGMRLKDWAVMHLA